MAIFNGFKGDFKGQTPNEVATLQEKYGKNELVPEKKQTFIGKIFGIFKEPMFILLFATAFFYFFLGEPNDGIIMVCFVTFMSSISLFQEWKADKTLQALKELSAPKVKVIRNGELTEICSTLLTVGDLVMVEEGERISADGRIVEMYDLGIDESSLTGESETVWKKAVISSNDKESQWRKDMCYAGTTVIQGRAIIEITATGITTEYGKIGKDVAEAPDRPTPLEKQTRHLIKISAFVGLGMFVLVFLATLNYTKDFIESALSGITLAMAMIPEEFPVILTVFLAMGAWRLARKNSLVKRMPSVETLGAVSVLCVDKTGTLTENKMSVRELYMHNNTEKDLLNIAGLACEPEPFDPMEKAILEKATETGLNKSDLFERELLDEYPFSSESKMMGHVWKDGENKLITAKGSPESILPLCGLSQIEQTKLEELQIKMANNGYRVIAVAKQIVMDEIPNCLTQCKLEFVGFIGLADPPRNGVKEAIEVCNKAGVRVVMITGDNGITAAAIARQLGICNSENVLTGPELENMSDEELIIRAKETNIFSRVMPRHKMRIVKALKDGGEIVAMTGDGVNDAPALKYSDIGIAMGKRGTGVAREAADMILLDDNFTTIVDTIHDGRRIYDNIKKAVGYVFVIHIPIALTAFLAPLLNLPLLLLPIHVVLLELVIDPTCSIVFERQPAERDIMKRKPRPATESLVTSGLIIKALFQGLSIFVATFLPYLYFVNSNAYTENFARSFSLVVFIFANIMLVYINQSEKEYAIKGFICFLKDKVLWITNVIIITMLFIILYIPQANVITKTEPLNATELLIAIGTAFIATTWWELVKLFKKIRA